MVLFIGPERGCHVDNNAQKWDIAPPPPPPFHYVCLIEIMQEN